MEQKLMLLYRYRCEDGTIDDGKLTIIDPYGIKLNEKNKKTLARIIGNKLKIHEMIIDIIIKLD